MKYLIPILIMTISFSATADIFFKDNEKAAIDSLAAKNATEHAKEIYEWVENKIGDDKVDVTNP